jgi:hypothetical protein
MRESMIHLVVHGQPEQHGDQDDRQEADDRAGRGGPDQLVCAAPFDDRDDGAERGSNRQQKPSAASIGTTIDRNLINSTTSARPTTRAANGSNDELSRSETSMPTAVGPVTETAAPSVTATAGPDGPAPPEPNRLQGTGRFGPNPSCDVPNNRVWRSAAPRS